MFDLGTTPATFAEGSIPADLNGVPLFATNNLHALSAANTNAANVKAQAGRVFVINAINTVASIRYLKLYNKATAPAPASDTPLKTYQIPASGTLSVSIPNGIGFSNGIGIAVVAGIADNDATAIGAGDILLDLSYA